MLVLIFPKGRPGYKSQDLPSLHTVEHFVLDHRLVKKMEHRSQTKDNVKDVYTGVPRFTVKLGHVMGCVQHQLTCDKFKDRLNGAAEP